MFNLLKSDLYRLVHGKMLWVMTGVVLLMAALMVVALSTVSSAEFLYMSSQSMEFAVNSSPEAAAAVEGAAESVENAMDELDEDDLASDPDAAAARALLAMEKPASELTVADFEEVSRDMHILASPTDMLGDAGFSGGEVPLLVCLLVALFFASDFTTGFVRNVVMDGRGRVRYYGAKLILVALASLYFVLLTALASAVAFAVGGYTYASGNTVGEIAGFLALAWLIACTYGWLTAALVWLTRSPGAGVAFAIVIGSGMAGALVGAVLNQIGMGFPWVSSPVPWMLSTGQNAMAGGMAGLMGGALSPEPFAVPPAVRIVVAAAFWMAVSAGISLGCLRKRDV